MISFKQKQLLDNILQALDNKELIKLAIEMDTFPIPQDANIRQIAFHIAASWNDTYIGEVASSLALALASRLEMLMAECGKEV